MNFKKNLAIDADTCLFGGNDSLLIDKLVSTCKWGQTRLILYFNRPSTFK